MITTRYLYRQLHLFGFVGLALVSSGFLINFSLAVTKYTVGLTLTETRPLLLLVLGIFMIIIGLQMFLSGLLGEIVFKLTGDKKINYVVKNVIG
jgi:vacuolar-type H+-ATPase subunit I/STV1